MAKEKQPATWRIGYPMDDFTQPKPKDDQPHKLGCICKKCDPEGEYQECTS